MPPRVRSALNIWCNTNRGIREFFRIGGRFTVFTVHSVPALFKVRQRFSVFCRVLPLIIAAADQGEDDIMIDTATGRVQFLTDAQEF